MELLRTWPVLTHEMKTVATVTMRTGQLQQHSGWGGMLVDSSHWAGCRRWQQQLVLAQWGGKTAVGFRQQLAATVAAASKQQPPRMLSHCTRLQPWVWTCPMRVRLPALVLPRRKTRQGTVAGTRQLLLLPLEAVARCSLCSRVYYVQGALSHCLQDSGGTSRCQQDSGVSSLAALVPPARRRL